MLTNCVDNSIRVIPGPIVTTFSPQQANYTQKAGHLSPSNQNGIPKYRNITNVSRNFGK